MEQQLSDINLILNKQDYSNRTIKKSLIWILYVMHLYNLAKCYYYHKQIYCIKGEGVSMSIASSETMIINFISLK